MVALGTVAGLVGAGVVLGTALLGVARWLYRQTLGDQHDDIQTRVEALAGRVTRLEQEVEDVQDKYRRMDHELFGPYEDSEGRLARIESEITEIGRAVEEVRDEVTDDTQELDTDRDRRADGGQDCYDGAVADWADQQAEMEDGSSGALDPPDQHE